MKYPRNLKKGDIIATTAPSAGIIKPVDLDRLDNVKNNFEKYGYKYLETKNVRTDENGRSSTGEQRASQLMALWENKEVSAIISASGGDFLNETIDNIDFEKLKQLQPTWFQGYSDNTGITFLLNTICDIACIYGQNIKDFGMKKLHPSLENSFKIMEGKEICQNSYSMCESNEWTERIDPYEEYKLTVKNNWKTLNGESKINFKGRSIGGCFDVIVNLIGTKYDKVSNYIEKYKEDGIIWFLEVFEMSTPQVYLHLWQMKNSGYFKNCKGIIFGRSLMLREDYGIDFRQAIYDAIGELNIPIIYDADIGHVSPQIPILSGGILDIEVNEGKGSIKNYFE